MCTHAHWGKKWSQLRSVAPNPWALTLHQPRQSHIFSERSSTPSDLLFQSLALALNRVENSSEPRRSPNSHLALALVPQIPALSLTKSAAASTPWDEMQLMVTSKLAPTSKALGTCRRHRDNSTQGHAFKTRITDSFT